MVFDDSVPPEVEDTVMGDHSKWSDFYGSLAEELPLNAPNHLVER